MLELGNLSLKAFEPADGLASKKNYQVGMHVFGRGVPFRGVIAGMKNYFVQFTQLFVADSGIPIERQLRVVQTVFTRYRLIKHLSEGINVGTCCAGTLW